MIPLDSSMRGKFATRARWRMWRKPRGFLPLRRTLFRRRLRRAPARKVAEMLGRP